MSRSIEEVVREKYGAVAASSLSSEHAGVRSVAEAFGYSAEELASIPAEANMGLSCGNPTATANLRPGEVVVDLGCGGGLDVFLAAKKVGPTGKAIGIDMTPEMLDRARANAERQGLANVEFHRGDHRQAAARRMPPSIASSRNCVINLAPDKRAVFREIARVLEAGRAACGLRHRAEEAAPARDRQRPPGLRRLHRRGHSHRGVRVGAQGRRVLARSRSSTPRRT